MENTNGKIDMLIDNKHVDIAVKILERDGTEYEVAEPGNCGSTFITVFSVSEDYVLDVIDAIDCEEERIERGYSAPVVSLRHINDGYAGRVCKAYGRRTFKVLSRDQEAYDEMY